jgi:branched-subunit amino acid transport protein
VQSIGLVVHLPRIIEWYLAKYLVLNAKAASAVLNFNRCVSSAARIATLLWEGEKVSPTLNHTYMYSAAQAR